MNYLDFRIFQVDWIWPDSIDSMIWSWKDLELGNMDTLSKDDVPGNQVKCPVNSAHKWHHDLITNKDRCFELYNKI